MAMIKKTEVLTKTELTSLLNRQNYKSIELFEDVNSEVIDLLKRVKRSDNVKVLVITKWLRVLTKLTVSLCFYD